MRVYLRDATEQDRDLLFQWTNDEEVRKNSFSMEKIAYKEHCRWFDKMMQNENCIQWILLADDEPVGQIRVSIEGESAEIGYSVSAERRGEGFGKLMLRQAMERVRAEFPTIRKLIAKVKPENIASRKVFADNGYRMIYEQFEFDIDRDSSEESVANHTIESIDNSFKGGVLLLTNNINALQLYNWLSARENVILFSEAILEKDVRRLQPKLIVSYNYMHIIKEDTICYCEHKQIPILNLHISFLPWNKGSNPNFWSFVEDTPKGVTIHKISKGLDEGAIISRKEIFFDTVVETFASTYQKLNDEIVQLFIDNWDKIKEQKYTAIPQECGGSYHNMRDFRLITEKCPVDWDENIDKYLKKLKKA